MLPSPPKPWAHLPFFDAPYAALSAKLAKADGAILPANHQIFAALEALAPQDVRVVILGQDPYPTPGHAHGFAFSVEPETAPLPRSLSNIFKELQDEFHETPPNGDLRFWARQGVLLLNTALTVKAGNAGAHAKLGWSQLARDVLRALSDQPRAFLLWGKHAQSFASEISGQDHLLIQTAHPSPLSARRGFFGARPFSKTNAWLKAQGHAEINWTRP